MRKIKLFFSLLLLLLTITACNDKELLDDVNEKTLLVYYPWTGSANDTGITEYLKNNITQMQNAITSSSTLDKRRVFILMANSTSETNLYELVYNGSVGTKELIKEYGEAQRFSTKEGIQEVLQDVKSMAPALNYAFITGGHGCGWVPDSCWEEYPKKLPHKFFGSATDLKNYSINVTELASAIQDAGMHMQYILFDNCYMQNIETAYALKDVTNFLIGSTTEILNMGMPYSTTFSQLIATAPNYSTITQAYYNYYSNYYGTLSVIDCRHIDVLVEKMRQLNSEFTFNESKLSDVQVTDGFVPSLFFDFRDYSRVLCDSDSVNMHQLDSLLKIVVRSEVHTTHYISFITDSEEEDPKIDTLKVHSGLTISDPSEHAAALKVKQKTRWWKATH